MTTTIAPSKATPACYSTSPAPWGSLRPTGSTVKRKGPDSEALTVVWWRRGRLHLPQLHHLIPPRPVPLEWGAYAVAWMEAA